MIKLIASDMDGTLLKSNNEFEDGFFEVFNELREKHIIFAAASGRQYYNLIKRFDDIKDHMMFIAENGTYVVYNGKELIVNPLQKDIAIELINIGRTIENSFVVLCGKNSAYIDTNDARVIEQVSKYYERYEIVDDITLVDDDILKVTMLDFIGSEKNSYNYFKNYFDKVQVTVSGHIWLDVVAKDINKGVAIKEIQELLNINYDETMVFGDFLNDLEMMDSAYYSFAMKNGHALLKERARFIAESNDDNGVVQAIKEYAL